MPGRPERTDTANLPEGALIDEPEVVLARPPVGKPSVGRHASPRGSVPQAPSPSSPSSRLETAGDPWTANGHTPNGTKLNGHTLNGHTLNGHAPNGHATNGTKLNGSGHAAVVNATSLDDAPRTDLPLNGTPAAPDAAPPAPRPVPPTPDYALSFPSPPYWTTAAPLPSPRRSVPVPPAPAPVRPPVDATTATTVDDFDAGPKDWVRKPSTSVGSAASSAKWAFAGLGVRSVVGGVSAFALARFVGPHTYGVIGLGLTYVAISNVLVDQGMGQALIRMRGLRRGDVATMQVTTIAIAVIAGTLTAASSGFWQQFFHAPGFGALLATLGLGLILKTVGLPGTAVLQRDGQFKWLAGCDVASAIASTAAGLAVAAVTHSALSLAAQILVNDGLYSFLIGIRSGVPIRGANRRALREMFGFTAKVAGSLWLGFIGKNADNALIGRVLGQQLLAYYLVSYRFMTLPIQNLTTVANRVLYPTYARIREDTERFRAAFLRTCSLMSIVATPLMACLFIFSDPLIVGLLGPEWRPAVIPTQVLSLVAIIQVQTSLITPPIVAFGRTGWQLIWSLAYTFLTVALFAVTVHWGVNAVCYGYLAANLITLPAPIQLVGRLGGFTLRDFAVAVLPGIAFGGLVAAIGYGIREIMLAALGIPAVAVAIVGGGLSLALGAGAVAALYPETLKQLRALR